MEQVLMKASAFVFIIIIGYVLKKRKFFAPDDYRIVTKIDINITLPAAIINSFGSFQKDDSLFILVLLGLGCNMIMIFLGYLLSNKKDDKMRALYMLNLSGYNIGAFTLPFVQNFLGAFGVVAVCMFDIGNSISCTGGSYAVTSAVIGSKEKASFVQSIKKLFSSVPFVTYTGMLVLTLLNIHIPKAIISITSVIGAANGFASMLMIGMMFEIKFRYDYLSKAGFILIIRYIASSILAFIFYRFMPFPLEIRQVLVIAVFAPVSALSAVFTEKCDGDVGIAGFASSASIIISISIITILLVTMGIGV